MLKLLENMCKSYNEALFVVVYNTIKSINTKKLLCYIIKKYCEAKSYNPFY